MIKQLRIGKSRPRSLGPYTFVRYKGKMCTTAVVRNVMGRLIEFAAGHLLPVIGLRTAEAFRSGELRVPVVTTGELHEDAAAARGGVL